MKILCYLTMVMLCGSAAMAEETFFSALESKAEVENEGGTVDGGSFKPGKFWQRLCQRESWRCDSLPGGRPIRQS